MGSMGRDYAYVLAENPMLNQNGVVQFGPTRPVPNALALEYQRDYGTAWRDLNLADLVNNPAANGVCRVFGVGFEKEPIDLFPSQLRSLFEDLPNSALIRLDRL